MATYQNNIMLGIKLESQANIQNQLNELIRRLNNSRLNLDLNINNTRINETQRQVNQLVNTLNRTNNVSYFSGLTSVLGRIGIYTSAYQVISEITDQFKKAGDYTLTMDKHLSSIQMITGRTREQVVEITNSFKELGSVLHTTNADMLSSASEMMRAGYSDSDSKKMIEQAVIGSKISNQTTETVSQQLITLKNSFDMSADGMSHVIDIFSKLDNSSATSFQEIATAIQRTAYNAKEANVDLDTLASYVTVVSEKTRKEASVIGESFKSIFSRYHNVKLGSLDESGQSINDVEKSMNRIGISIRSSKGEFKDFNSVLESFMGKIKEGSLSQVDTLAAVNALAGSRQKETLLSLINNMDTLKQHQEDLTNATGTAKEMFDSVYSNSLDAKVNDLKRAFEGLYETIMSSDSLKWMITEATQLVTALSNVDGKTIAFIATVGSLVLVMSKLSKINKELLAMGAISEAMGLTKFLGLATGIGVFSKGTTGLGVAFKSLGYSIKSATSSAIIFMMTPLGLTLGALAITLGIVVGGFVSYQHHQAELTEQSKTLKTAIEEVNSALANGDTKGASDNLEIARKEQAELEKLVKLKKETQDKLNNASESKIVGQGGLTEAQQLRFVLTGLNKQIEEHEKVMKDAGISADTLVDAESKIANTSIVNKIKEEAKAQIENRENTEGATKEYNNYISTVKDLYSQYQNLSAQENLSAEQKTKLGEITAGLQGHVSNLNVKMDENGKVYISNTGLVDDMIGYLESENLTVDTLTQTRIQEAKMASQCQVGNTQIVYSEVVKRINLYKAEIQAIQQAISAQSALANKGTAWQTINDGDSDALKSMKISSQGAELNSQYRDYNSKNPEFEAKRIELEELTKAKNLADEAFKNITIPNAPSGGTPDTNYTPSGGGSKGDSSSAEKYADKIAEMTSNIEVDKYLDFNNAIKEIDNSLTENTTLMDSLKEGSPEYQQAQLKEIDLLKQKQVATTNITNAYKKEAEEEKNRLTNLGFQFDANGKLINSQQTLLTMQEKVNALGGDSKEDQEAKQKAIDKLKEINTEVKNYGTLINDTIPSAIDDYNKLTNTIKKTHEQIKKTNEETLKNTRDELVGYYLEQQAEKVEKLQKSSEKAYDKAKKALELEKQSTLDNYDAQIKAKQDLIDSLDDDTSDNETKLKALIKDRDNWLKDNSSYSESHVNSLNTQIAELEKTMKKNSIQKDIDSLNQQKNNASDSYDKQLKDLEESNTKQEEANEKKYKKLLDSKKAYQKIDKMITDDNEKAMVKLYESYGDSYKEIGTLYGENITNAFKEKIKDMETIVKDMAKNISDSLDVDIDIDSSSGGSSKGDKTTTNSNGTTTTTHSDGTKTYSNGDYTDKNGYYYSTNKSDTYYDASSGTYKKYSSYASGGRTPSNIDNGALAILHSDEKILNAKDTITFDDSMLKIDEMYNSIKSSGVLLGQYANISNLVMPTLGFDLNKIANSVTNNNNTTGDTKVEIKNEFNITNESSFDAKTMPSDIVKALNNEIKNIKFNKLGK